MNNIIKTEIHKETLEGKRFLVLRQTENPFDFIMRGAERKNISEKN